MIGHPLSAAFATQSISSREVNRIRYRFARCTCVSVPCHAHTVGKSGTRSARFGYDFKMYVLGVCPRRLNESCVPVCIVRSNKNRLNAIARVCLSGRTGGRTDERVCACVHRLAFAYVLDCTPSTRRRLQCSFRVMHFNCDSNIQMKRK